MGNFALFDAAEDKKLADFFFGVLEIESSVRSKVPSGFVRGLEKATVRRLKGKTAIIVRY